MKMIMKKTRKLSVKKTMRKTVKLHQLPACYDYHVPCKQFFVSCTTIFKIVYFFYFSGRHIIPLARLVSGRTKPKYFPKSVESVVSLVFWLKIRSDDIICCWYVALSCQHCLPSLSSPPSLSFPSSIAIFGSPSLSLWAVSSLDFWSKVGNSSLKVLAQQARTKPRPLDP